MSRPLPFSSGNQQCSYRTYTLPEDRSVASQEDQGFLSNDSFIRGKIHLIQGHPLINEEANQIFREYQEQASSGQLKFRRFPMKSVSTSSMQDSCTISLTFVLRSTNVNTVTWQYESQLTQML